MPNCEQFYAKIFILQVQEHFWASEVILGQDGTKNSQFYSKRISFDKVGTFLGLFVKKQHKAKWEHFQLRTEKELIILNSIGIGALLGKVGTFLARINQKFSNLQVQEHFWARFRFDFEQGHSGKNFRKES